MILSQIFWATYFRLATMVVFIVYCKLQSTQLFRVISKVEVRKGREAGTVNRWFTGIVLIELSLPAIIVWVVCRMRGWRELWSVDYCAQCCGFCICWRWFESLPLRKGYRSHCASFGWSVPEGTADHSEHFWLECLEDLKRVPVFKLFFLCQTLSAVCLKFKTEQSFFVPNIVNSSLKLSSLVVTLCTIRLNIQKFHIMPTRCIYKFASVSGQTACFALHRIKRHIVYNRGAGFNCAARTNSFKKNRLQFVLNGLMVKTKHFWGAQTLSAVRLTGKTKQSNYPAYQKELILHLHQTTSQIPSVRMSSTWTLISWHSLNTQPLPEPLIW